MQVNRILIPNKPHLDPIAAIYLLGKYGKEYFPGIDKAKISYWEYSRDPNHEELEKMKEEGVLMIDMGGSLFDHHSKKGADGETSTSLVASCLGIKEKAELATLLNYVREDDLEGLHNRFGDLAYTLKAMYKQDIPSDQVVVYALQAIDILQKGQIQWHHEVRKEFEEKAKIIKIKRFKRKIKVAIIESDNVQVANYAITVANMSVVIQKRSTGHVMILTNKHHRIDLREIVAAIRKKELEVRGYEKDVDPQKLQFEGKNTLLPNWFYHRSLNSMLNGSDALCKVEATKVPFGDLVKFVLYGLTTDESELCDCDKSGQNCPYRKYGFKKCLDKSRK